MSTQVWHQSHSNGASPARHWLWQLLERRGLDIAFQPIVERASAAGTPGAEVSRAGVFGYECLLRGWLGETLISPQALFAVARARNATASLDLAARSLALQAAARHGVRQKLFINFAPGPGSEMMAGSALQHTRREVEALGLSPSQIVFEIVESDCLRDWPQCRALLDAYREAGFGLALDDFGAGHSSLQRLNQLRPDCIKIDQSLLAQVHHDSFQATVARKLLETAQELGIATVAEGIENKGEYDWACRHGVDYLQGFYLAVPGRYPVPNPCLAPSPHHAVAGLAAPAETPESFASAGGAACRIALGHA